MNCKLLSLSFKHLTVDLSVILTTFFTTLKERYISANALCLADAIMIVLFIPEDSKKQNSRYILNFLQRCTVQYTIIMRFWIIYIWLQNRIQMITMRYSKTQPPDFPPKGLGHVVSNFLLSAGILAQYKTFHVSFKKYLYFEKNFSSLKVEKQG